MSPDHYTASFGLQWKTFRQTQLDSHTGVPISRERLTRIAGGPLEQFAGKTVLEAGCGAGRFTELLLAAGAIVYAVDASVAVEANLQNCGNIAPDRYCICQADLLEMPFAPASFDVVICVGVIQHTPDPERTIALLAELVRPGGRLLIDHYSQHTQSGLLNLHKAALRRALLATPVPFRMRFCRALVSLLWPMHRAAWKLRSRTGWRWPHGLLRIASPVYDYQKRYPDLSDELQRQWAILDTHDGLTDEYKHLRSTDQIAAGLRACGLTDIHTEYAGNGVEARATRPSH